VIHIWALWPLSAKYGSSIIIVIIVLSYIFPYPCMNRFDYSNEFHTSWFIASSLPNFNFRMSSSTHSSHSVVETLLKPIFILTFVPDITVNWLAVLDLSSLLGRLNIGSDLYKKFIASRTQYNFGIGVSVIRHEKNN